MAIHLSPVHAGHDFPRLAELISTVSVEPISAETLRACESSAAAGHILWRVTAVGDDGRIVGYGDAEHDETLPAGHFRLMVAVDPAARGRGIGTMLYDDVAQFAWELGARALVAEIRAGCRDALRFARRRGFRVVARVPLPRDTSEQGQSWLAGMRRASAALGVTLVPQRVAGYYRLARDLE